MGAVLVLRRCGSSERARLGSCGEIRVPVCGKLGRGFEETKGDKSRDSRKIFMIRNAF